MIILITSTDINLDIINVRMKTNIRKCVSYSKKRDNVNVKMNRSHYWTLGNSCFIWICKYWYFNINLYTTIPTSNIWRKPIQSNTCCWEIEKNNNCTYIVSKNIIVNSIKSCFSTFIDESEVCYGESDVA